MHAAGNILSDDVSIAGFHVELQFARDVQLDLHGFVLTAKEGEIKVGHLHADDDVIAVLALFDTHIAGADFVAFGGDTRVNLLLVGADDGDVAIVGGDAEVGAGADLVSLGPVVSVRGSRSARCHCHHR
jgi:hypothetical protein